MGDAQITVGTVSSPLPLRKVVGRPVKGDLPLSSADTAVIDATTVKIAAVGLARLTPLNSPVSAVGTVGLAVSSICRMPIIVDGKGRHRAVLISAA